MEDVYYVSSSLAFFFPKKIIVTHGVNLNSYTFFKPLDLSKFIGLKKTLINANILIDLIYYHLFNTFHIYF